MRGDFLSRIKFAVIGGDKRYKYLCGILEKEGWTVNVHGNKYCKDDGYENTLKNANAVIAPIPFSKDEEKRVFPEKRQRISFRP